MSVALAILVAAFAHFFRDHDWQKIGNARVGSQIFEHIFIQRDDLRNRALQVIGERAYLAHMLYLVAAV